MTDLRIYTLTRTTPQVDTDRADDWRELASCLDSDPEVFFPDTYPGVSDWDTPRKICARCPVREDCLQFAIRNKETAGMFGGLTVDERKQIRRGSAKR